MAFQKTKEFFYVVNNIYSILEMFLRNERVKYYYILISYYYYLFFKDNAFDKIK